MALLKKLPEQWRKLLLSKYPLIRWLLNKIKDKIKINTQNILWHLHTIQKLNPLKIWEIHFPLVWVMEPVIISTFFRKGKVFSENSNLTNLVGTQR